ncbi:MAG: hypothetical protein AVDCRST_MAG59-64 [uncultured Thermomicrobiales bacterium]|uniref:M20/M25/M40 family metallo-hydrolase n=1 Tax=uncultured Thermomicrobiales bacterium TaxID=1645740 RepID=A0A6J4TVU5_9BACT|nr:MAG: hypothetical protein AVDCRST_MAG59-64 [uncultured Thermomicrobiales bacterium]
MIEERVVGDILTALDAHDGLFDLLQEEITTERAYAILAALEASPTPSQTAQWARVPVVEGVLREGGLLADPSVTWVADYAGSGNAVLLLGREPRAKKVWMFAHLDQISYLVDPGEDGSYPLMPFCYHMQKDGARAAIALGPDLGGGGLEVRARGTIRVAGSGVTFEVTEGGPLGPGTRVVYDSDLRWDRATGRLTGYLDDSVACSAILLAAGVLRRFPVELLVGLTDEEEGPPGDANQSFARGGRRLLPWFDPPALAIVSDVHESEAMVRGPGPRNLRPGDGAVFAERSSSGRGTATPPHLYALQQHLATALDRRGVRLRENWGGYVSRSEDINATAATPNIALVGVLCSNRHYALDAPAANLLDVVDLAKVLVAYTLLAHDPSWPLVGQERPAASRPYVLGGRP